MLKLNFQNPSIIEDCPSDYCYGDPYDCNKFYICVLQMWVIKRCNPGFKFNHKKCECEPKINENESCVPAASKPDDSNFSNGSIVLWILFTFLLTLFIILLFFALQCEVTLARHRLLGKGKQLSCYEKNEM